MTLGAFVWGSPGISDHYVRLDVAPGGWEFGRREKVSGRPAGDCLWCDGKTHRVQRRRDGLGEF